MVATRLMRVLFAIVVSSMVVAVAVAASSPGDGAFDSDGLVEHAQPSWAREAQAGIVDLAGAPEQGMVAALGGLARGSYFGAARFNGDGSLDESFGDGGFTAQLQSPPSKLLANLQIQAEAVAAQSDGKIVVVGNRFEVRPGEAESHVVFGREAVIARYDADGALDPSFGTEGVASLGQAGLENFVYDVGVGAGGRIILVGRSELRGEAMVAALTPDGTLDRGFGRRGVVRIRPRGRRVAPRFASAAVLSSVRVGPDGRILAAGYLDGGLVLVRLNADGSMDRSFGGDGLAAPRIHAVAGACCPVRGGLAVQADGRILVLGHGIGAPYEGIALARFRANGRLDREFGRRGLVAPGEGRGIEFPDALALRGDGRIIVAGYGLRGRGASARISFEALRFLPDGTRDRSFAANGLQVLALGDVSSAQGAIARADGSVVVGGALQRRLGDRRETELLLARYSGSR